MSSAIAIITPLLAGLKVVIVHTYGGVWEFPYDLFVIFSIAVLLVACSAWDRVDTGANIRKRHTQHFA